MKQNAIWDYFQGDGVSSFDGSAARLAYLVRQVPHGGKILTIGVGGGQLEYMLSSRSEIFCLDPSESAIDNLRQELGLGERAKVGYSQEIPFGDGMFDAVIMSEVLEHLSLEVLESTLCEVRRVLRKNSVFIGTVPANEVLSEQNVVCPECSHRFHRWGHVQTFTTDRLRRVLATQFSVELLKIKAFANTPPNSLKGKLSALARTSLFHLRFGPYGKNANIVFVGRNVKT